MDGLVFGRVREWRYVARGCVLEGWVLLYRPEMPEKSLQRFNHPLVGSAGGVGMKLWDFTMYTILTVLLVDRYSETGITGYIIMIAFMIFAFGKKHFSERGN